MRRREIGNEARSRCEPTKSAIQTPGWAPSDPPTRRPQPGGGHAEWGYVHSRVSLDALGRRAGGIVPRGLTRRLIQIGGGWRRGPVLRGGAHFPVRGARREAAPGADQMLLATVADMAVPADDQPRGIGKTGPLLAADSSGPASAACGRHQHRCSSLGHPAAPSCRRDRA